jgi:anti-sigma-K factor RskA
MSHLPTAADWRDLAHQVQNEKDPRKMVELAQQLVAKLDEEVRKAAPHRD